MHYDRSTQKRHDRKGRFKEREPEVVTTIIDKRNLILRKENPVEFIDLAQEFGKMLARKGVTTSQLRKFYFDVKRLPIEFTEARYDLQMMRPRLAYAKGKKRNLTNFQKVMESLITNISTNKDLEGFKDFFEAIIAYHKAEGGRD